MARGNHVKDQLSDYVVGALIIREQERVQRHLSECEECRAELAALERTGEKLEAFGLMDAPRDVWNGVRQRIRERAPAQRRWRPAWAMAMGAAALVLIVIGVVLLRPVGVGEPSLIVVAEPDEEMQATIEGHLPTAWAAPLADHASLGLRLELLEDDG